jgi:hypothetical protein
MLHDHFHDVLAIGAAVGTETPDMNAERPHHLEKTAVSLCLLEAHVTVAVAILRSNMSKTKNIPPKAVIFSDFCCTFAMSLMILLVFFAALR